MSAQAILDHAVLRNLITPGKVHHIGRMDQADYSHFLFMAQNLIIPSDAAIIVIAVEMKVGEVCYILGGRHTFLYDPGSFEWDLLRDELIQKAGGDPQYIPLVYAVNEKLYTIHLP